MNSTTFKIAALLVALLATPGFAGVIVTEKTSTTGGMGSGESDRTVMVQGNKQKMTSGKQSVILDIDKGSVLILNPDNKTYVEAPFPPTGPMAAMMQSMGGMNLQFKKTGSSKTVAGYHCDEYTGSGSMMMGDYTVTACFSTDAPGAADYSAFDKQMAEKLKGSAMSAMGAPPAGVPLSLESTTKLKAFQIPGMDPEQAKKLGAAMTGRPPIVSTTVATSIKSETIPDEAFVVPAGYTRREIRMGPPPSAAPGGAPSAAPQ
ncbi:MAG TPA: DUF4412 domain-containing protein [Candidatus Binataceae bacterium]